jgi:hypothetical protein
MIRNIYLLLGVNSTPAAVAGTQVKLSPPGPYSVPVCNVVPQEDVTLRAKQLPKFPNSCHSESECSGQVDRLNESNFAPPRPFRPLDIQCQSLTWRFGLREIMLEMSTSMSL